jgi:hypothetical protein
MNLESYRRRFGSRFVNLASDSPLLLRDLRLLEERGVSIRRINGKSYAYSRSSTEANPNGLICIGSNASPLDKVILLAHEAHHILRGRAPSDPDPSRMSRKRFVSLCMQEEARAMLHECRVTEQLYDAGHRLPFKHMSYMASYFRGGYAAIRAMIESDCTIMDDISHSEDYGRRYDREHKNMIRTRGTLSRSALRRRRAA